MVCTKDVSFLSMSLRMIHSYGHNIPILLCPMSKISHRCYEPKVIPWSVNPRILFYLGHNVPVFSGTV